jgi:hypothetical protein
MFSRSALLCTAIAALAFAQTVDMHFVPDDVGEVWLNGQRVIPPHLAYDTTQDTTTFPAPLRWGDNALAIRCMDWGWTAGFAVSMDLATVGCPDTVRSDTVSFSCLDREAVSATGAEISTVGFDASGWIAPGDYGAAGYDSASVPPFVNPRDLPAAAWQLRYQGARWLWGPHTIYIRKSLTAGDSVGAVLLRGEGFTFEVYLNGVLVGHRDTQQHIYDSLEHWEGLALHRDAENVVAIKATCVDAIDGAFMKAGLRWTTFYDAQVLSDTTWRYAWSLSPGWNDTGFIDSNWVQAGAKRAYDRLTDALRNATWIWATDMWFRTEFNLPTAGVMHGPGERSTVRARSPASFWYTLAGQRVPAVLSLRHPAGVVVVEPSRDRSATVSVPATPR